MSLSRRELLKAQAAGIAALAANVGSEGVAQPVTGGVDASGEAKATAKPRPIAARWVWPLTCSIGRRTRSGGRRRTISGRRWRCIRTSTTGRISQANRDRPGMRSLLSERVRQFTT